MDRALVVTVCVIEDTPRTRRRAYDPERFPNGGGVRASTTDSSSKGWLLWPAGAAFVGAIVIAATSKDPQIAATVAGGARAAGVWLEPAFEACTRSLVSHTDGVLHYVGVHSESTLGSVWGACFDGSSFIQRTSECEGAVVFLPGAPAIHGIGPTKCSLVYLLRRASWQGGSDVRRGDWREGLEKELGRIRSGGSTLARLCIVPAFTGAVVAGMATELTLAGRLADRRRAEAGSEPQIAEAERAYPRQGGHAYVAGIPDP
jgi:hypothetical protein